MSRASDASSCSHDAVEGHVGRHNHPSHLDPPWLEPDRLSADRSVSDDLRQVNRGLLWIVDGQLRAPGALEVRVPALSRAGDAAPTRPDELGGSGRLGGGRLLLARLGLGLRAGTLCPERDRGQHGDADGDGGADGSGHVQPGGERIAGPGQQRGAGAVGELPGDAHRTPEGIAGGRGGLARDASREAAGKVGAVDTIRSVVAVNTGPSPSETTVEAAARIARSASRDPPTLVSTARPTAVIARPAPITSAGRTCRRIQGARFDPTISPPAHGSDHSPARSGGSPSTSCRYWATNRK